MPEHIDSPECSCWGCIEENNLRSRAASALGLLGKERRRADLVEIDQKVPIEYCLIDQLQQCLVNSTGGKNVGRARPGMPYDSVASEMWTALWLDLRNDVLDCTLFSEPDTPQHHALTLLGHINSLPIDWLSQRIEGWEKWGKAIEAHVHPERLTPIIGTCPNPECGQSTWYSYDNDGDRLGEPTLTLTWAADEVTGMKCQCCFSTWARSELLGLARVLNENLGKALAEAPDGC